MVLYKIPQADSRLFNDFNITSIHNLFFFLFSISTETQNEIYAVNFSKMKFTKVFFKSDDYITAMDVFPLNKKLICCANYSGRLVLYDYHKKVQIIENQLKLRKRKSSMSDVDVIEIPHISTLAYSRNGHHLMCGLENGTVICLDPDVLHEIRSFNVMQNEIAQIKFSSDSFFVAIYVSHNMLIILYLCIYEHSII